MSRSNSPKLQVLKLDGMNESPSPEALPQYDEYQIPTVTYVPYYIPVGVPMLPPPKRIHRFLSTLGRKHKRFFHYPCHGPPPPPLCYSPVFPTSVPNYAMPMPGEEMMYQPHMMGMPVDQGLPMYPPFSMQSLHS